MQTRKLMTPLILFLGAYVMLVVGCAVMQRKFLFFPSHHDSGIGLTAWKQEGRIIGYSRQVPAPQNVWLMLHGNAGQAADRAYAIPSFSGRDSVFILEYPGYGAREGKPSKASFDAAAAEGYLLLRNTFPKTPICVMAESIGCGPACALASQAQPPEKIVLVAPFDTLKSVAAGHFPFLPVGLILGESWDNIRALSGYKGPVEIFGALQDRVIPIEHAKKLADSLPSAKFHSIPGGHNDWSEEGRVAIRNP
ncbi:MAG: alpha/beta hydrolase [Verrucomicrobiota bacterium]|jgi:pimeloyl-ACP methyl ester carboxylesterase